MVSETQLIRIRAIQENASLVYSLEADPVVKAFLDQIALDMEWLCYNLSSAWSTVGAYQKELSQLLKKGL